MNSPRRAVATILVCGATLAACGGSGKPQGVAPTTTTPAERAASIKTASMGDFCGRLSVLTTATAEVGVVTDLAQVRDRLSAAETLADKATKAGTPPGSNTYLRLLALDADLHVVNAWVHGQATQSDLDHNRQPSGVRPYFVDMGVQYRYLEAWSTNNCQAFEGGDD